MTNEAKYTPGPWRMNGLLIASAHGDQIASVWDIASHRDAQRPHPESLDNARLIAAAPALLAALQAAELVIPRDRKVTLEAVRAAIAQATSEKES